MRPGPALLPLVALWCALGGLAAFWAPAGDLWLALGAGLGGAALLDGVRLRGARALSAERSLPGALALGVRQEIALQVHNAGTRPWRVTVFDRYPTTHEATGLPRVVRVPPGEHAAIPYHLRPSRRGPFTFEAIELLVEGPWRLLSRHLLAGTSSEIRVLPDFQAVARYAHFALDHREAAIGVHRRRRRGQGLEFFQLRDYREGDPLRQIDWKAVSRRCALVSRDYQEEQGQQIVLALDCGRRLHAQDGALRHFDQVLNAALLLGYVALRQGDAVGMMTFSGPERWLAPQRGRGALSTLVGRLYDLDTTSEPSDFREAARRLLASQRRRALVVLVTNLRDDDEEELAEAAALLGRRHLVLVASLREEVLDAMVEAPVGEFHDALHVAAAWRYRLARERTMAAVRRRGVSVVDVLPSELPLALVNRYLDIKRAGLL